MYECRFVVRLELNVCTVRTQNGAQSKLISYAARESGGAGNHTHRSASASSA